MLAQGAHIVARNRGRLFNRVLDGDPAAIAIFCAVLVIAVGSWIYKYTRRNR